ncbi:elongation factor G [Actinokineospora xionganensis]|uniref:TetM/TetW/TetO/TetS family tetracycline resistance ribosomal protection protein n=1 Tax=Actinokineospora xionganensis TaxID=2684470 RepID=A0ABR7L0X1_9PSEU|nr:TetM/TetW/TetO/TetS family tetracycline resistance ribosomal protection protein [Actinokineospora xionganensis]MBC6446017.1 TetM/TetW/TetO/TetS family tetracycline resistance ribosomal protection protein [Actinokineospora xionganensis]
MTFVNLGILAHVDAGKTSLTERLLFNAGLIDHVGSVDRGDTTTDSMELERRRGITIQSAVVALHIGDTQVNLIDTPGHSDFAGEVERALRVLDGAVLVISAVEGIQARTRIIMRLLKSLGIPVLLFVNKIDRMGARYEDLLKSINDTLAPGCVPMTEVTDIGTRGARAIPLPLERMTEVLAERSDTFLSAFVDDAVELSDELRYAELARQARAGWVHPVYFGSAITGEGVEHLARGIVDLLPSASAGAADDPPRATIFKIERGRAGEKICYARVHSGTIRARERIPFYRSSLHDGVQELTGRPSAVRVYRDGAGVCDDNAPAGSIAKLWGLAEARIGDQLGSSDDLPGGGLIAPPTLETVISPESHQDRTRLFTALGRLAEQDPLINIHQDKDTGVLRVRLYGEVQMEVIADTLREQFDLAVTFEEARTIYVERPTGVGEALEEINFEGLNFFWATVGLRIEPAPPGTGITFGLDVELGGLPLAFHKAIEETTRETLRRGPHGWEVIDVAVTLFRTGYASPISAAGDFRNATPLVVAKALTMAGTRVHEPVHRLVMEVPEDCVSAVMQVLVPLRAVVEEQETREATIVVLRGRLPASGVVALTRRVPELTRGEGVVVTEFDSYRPYPGTPPVNPRAGANPYDREQYMLHTLGRVP